MNKCILMGNLCADPEIKTTNSGTTIATFRVAVRRAMKNKDGQYESDFLNCVAFNKTAEFVEKYFTKGRRILVEGTIQTRTYDKDGEKRYATDIICNGVEFADAKPEAGNAAPAAPRTAKKAAPSATAGFQEVFDDSDLPF